MKATQLVDVISGVSPIRSVVNVGSGVADLVLLPISQYKKDGRVLRGLQKGSTAFVKSTAIEAIKLGARLATGTQVILEQAENVIGGQFNDPVMAEAVSLPAGYRNLSEELDEAAEDEEPISRYADQPANVKEGVASAYQSLRRNFNSAAQTILAVPMEVYERSGNEVCFACISKAVCTDISATGCCQGCRPRSANRGIKTYDWCKRGCQQDFIRSPQYARP